MPQDRAGRALRLPILVAALVLAAGLLWEPGAQAGPVSGKPVAGASAGKRLFWGATIGEQFTGQKAPWDMQPVHELQQLVGKPLSLISFFPPWMDCSSHPCKPYTFPTTPMQNVRAYGAIPVLNWSSEQTPQTVSNKAFQLSDIIHGRYDGYIRTFANRARQFGHPFFLRFDWEMNGFWNSWGQRVNGNRPGQYITAWRHVHRIFDQQGATNATWVWCPNIDFTHKLFPLERLYPGNRWVDWTCMSGFNWGKRSNTTWLSFRYIFRSTYRRIVHIAPKKPMILGEVGSNERGGSKAQWITNMLHVIVSRFPMMRGFAWFDVNDRGTNWPIESSQSSIDAFRTGLASSAFAGNGFGGLSGSPIQPPG